MRSLKTLLCSGILGVLGLLTGFDGQMEVSRVWASTPSSVDIAPDNDPAPFDAVAGADHSYMLTYSVACKKELLTRWVPTVKVSVGWDSLTAVYGGDFYEAESGPSMRPTFAAEAEYSPLQLDCSSDSETIPIAIWVGPSEAQPPLEPDWLVVVLTLQSIEQPRSIEGSAFYFWVGDGYLVPVSAEEYLQGRKVWGPDGWENPPVGNLTYAPAEFQNVSPLDNPSIPQEIKDRIRDELSPNETNPGDSSAASPEDASRPSRQVDHWALLLSVLAVVGLGFSVVRGGRGIRSVVALFPALALGYATEAKAVTHYVYGYVSYWDTRILTSDLDGSRRPVCDDADTNCTPVNGDECCFKGLPRLQIELHVCTPLECHIAETDQTEEHGFFLLADTNWDDDNYNWLEAKFQRAGYPAKMLLSTTETGDAEMVSTDIDLTNQYTQVANWSINPADNNDSTPEGAWGATWRTLHEAAMVAEDEGETHHRKTVGSGNTYDQIRVWMSETVGCEMSNASTIKLNPDYGRVGVCGAHEFGHLLMMRTSNNYVGNSTIAWYTASEHYAIWDGFASFFELLWFWDPDTALETDVRSFTSTYACVSTSSMNNTNDLAVQRNNMWGLWALVDTQTDNDDGNGDQADLTLADLMDAYALWQAASGSQGQNRRNSEFYVTWQASVCSTNEGCSGGQICLKSGTGLGQCYSGDPHGENLHDWAYYLPSVVAGLTYQVAEDTIESSTCVGPADDSYYFQGGGHSD